MRLSCVFFSKLDTIRRLYKTFLDIKDQGDGVMLCYENLILKYYRLTISQRPKGENNIIIVKTPTRSEIIKLRDEKHIIVWFYLI